MKKLLLFPAAILLLFCITVVLADLSAAREQEKAMAGVIRLHVRAADDSQEEQELKLKVRNGILACTERLLKDCKDPAQAKKVLTENLLLLESEGQAVVNENGFSHTVTVSLNREAFEYREYDGFFLPEGVYDSLIVNIGPGEGRNWWCVVFPAACYMGAAEEIETNAEQMPECFQIAKTRAKDVTVKFWIWEKIKSLFE